MVHDPLIGFQNSALCTIIGRKTNGVFTILVGLGAGVHPGDVNVRSCIADAVGVLDGEQRISLFCEHCNTRVQ
jgi:hypothetical protein